MTHCLHYVTTINLISCSYHLPGDFSLLVALRTLCNTAMKNFPSPYILKQTGVGWVKKKWLASYIEKNHFRTSYPEFAEFYGQNEKKSSFYKKNLDLMLP